MNALRFGEPAHPKTRKLVDGVVSGISFYGNCVGVPTVGGETNFDARYNGNILVNVFCLGIAPRDRIFTSAAKGAGNPVVYVGAKTGRDGIHGATMASAEFSDDSEAQRPTVQVGDPSLEKLLIEACLELMATDAIIGIQDMGAAGLTSSSVEMASKGEAGIELDLDRVPAREEGMTPYEFMLSESQERMLMVETVKTEDISGETIDEDRKRKILEDAIRTLPAQQKAVFNLRYYEELPYEDISRIMNRSVGGVKANYSCGVKKIGEYVKSRLGTENE